MSAGGEKSKSASQTDGKAAQNKTSDMGSYKVKYTHVHTQTTLDDQTSTDIPYSLVHTMWCSWLHANSLPSGWMSIITTCCFLKLSEGAVDNYNWQENTM